MKWRGARSRKKKNACLCWTYSLGCGIFNVRGDGMDKKRPLKKGEIIIDALTLVCITGVLTGMIFGDLEYGLLYIVLLCALNRFLNWIIKPIVLKIYDKE